MAVCSKQSSATQLLSTTLVYSETPIEFYLLLSLSGKRICPGEGLARMEIFLLIATILQNFTLKSVVNPQELNITPTLSGTGNVPPAYQLCAVPRWKALNHSPVSWNWLFLYMFFTKINSRSTGPPFPGLQEGSPNTRHKAETSEASQNSTTPQEALGDIAAACTDALSQDHWEQWPHQTATVGFLTSTAPLAAPTACVPPRPGFAHG